MAVNLYNRIRGDRKVIRTLPINTFIYGSPIKTSGLACLACRAISSNRDGPFTQITGYVPEGSYIMTEK